MDKDYRVDKDYEREGKELLLRALESMVANIEDSTRCHRERYEDGVKVRYNIMCDFSGEDLVKVYNAIIASKEDASKAAAESIKGGISDGLLKAILLG